MADWDRDEYEKEKNRSGRDRGFDRNREWADDDRNQSWFSGASERDRGSMGGSYGRDRDDDSGMGSNRGRDRGWTSEGDQDWNRDRGFGSGGGSGRESSGRDQYGRSGRSYGSQGSSASQGRNYGTGGYESDSFSALNRDSQRTGSRDYGRNESDFGERPRSNYGMSGGMDSTGRSSETGGGYGSGHYGTQGTGYGMSGTEQGMNRGYGQDFGSTGWNTGGGSMGLGTGSGLGSQGSYGTSGETGAYGSTGQSGTFGSTGTSQSFRGRGPKGFQRSDERVREMVSERLEDHDAIDASEIEVTVNNGEVTLSGHVEDRKMKRLAEDIIENLPGVKDVNNNLKVNRGLLDKISDALTGSGSDRKETPSGSTGLTGSSGTTTGSTTSGTTENSTTRRR